MKFARILSALAVFAAAGMAAAGCESPDGVGNGYDEAVSAEASGIVPGGGAPLLAAAAGTKTIKVKFEVKNGGNGLTKSEGMLISWDESKAAYNSAKFASDYTVTITVPAGDKYLLVCWKATEGFVDKFYLFAKMKAESCTITLDFNGYRDGRPVVATKNLEKAKPCLGDDEYWADGGWMKVRKYWEMIKSRAARN